MDLWGSDTTAAQKSLASEFPTLRTSSHGPWTIPPCAGGIRVTLRKTALSALQKTQNGLAKKKNSIHLYVILSQAARSRGKLIKSSMIYLDDASTEAPMWPMFYVDLFGSTQSFRHWCVACFNQVARRSPTPNPRQRVHKFPAYSGCHWSEAAKDRGRIYKILQTSTYEMLGHSEVPWRKKSPRL